MIIIFSALLVVFYGEIRAGLFAYVQGLLIDIISGGVLGLHALIYLLIFAGIKLGSYFFDLQYARGQLIIVALAVLLKGLISIALLYIFSWKIGLLSAHLLSISTSAICSGLLAYFLSYFLLHYKEGSSFYYDKEKI